MTDVTSKPITLHSRTDVKTKVDPGSRSVAFACAHPDGLLGAYEVVIPWYQLKRTMALILELEGNGEIARKQQQREQQTPKLVRE